MERLFDIFLSSIALIILSPLLVPIIILLKSTGEGEWFFMQKRMGKHGRLFKLIKFATMVKNSPNLGTGTVTMKQDPRVLPVGKFLRKTKINELPQLLNILLGDMSVIGPVIKEQQKIMNDCTEKKISLVKLQSTLLKQTGGSGPQSGGKMDLSEEDRILLEKLMREDDEPTDNTQNYKM